MRFSDQKLPILSKTTINALKGRPWSLFLEKPNDVRPSSTLNVSTPLIPIIGLPNKQIVKIPSSWKLVPINMSDIRTPSKIPTGDALSFDSSGMIRATLLCQTEFFLNFFF